VAIEMGVASAVCILWSMWCVPTHLVPLIVKVLGLNAWLSGLPLFSWYKGRLVAKMPAAA